MTNGTQQNKNGIAAHNKLAVAISSPLSRGKDAVEQYEGYTRTLTVIPVNRVDDAKYNPPGRVKPKQLSKLKEEVQAQGGVLQPIHVLATKNGRFLPADGHRRVYVSRELGLTTIRAYVYETNSNTDEAALLESLYLSLNKGTRPHTPAEKLATAIQGGPSYEPRIASATNWVRRLLTRAELQEFVANNNSPYTVTTALRIADYCLPGVQRKDPVWEVFAKKTLRWCLANQVQQYANLYMRNKYEYRTLKRAVDNNYSYVPRVSPHRPKVKTKTKGKKAGNNE